MLTLREPGGTAISEVVRAILLNVENVGLFPMAELMLYEAARRQLVVEKIMPALADGITVMCDRFFDSTTAYQWYARGLSLEDIRKLNAIATGGLSPDLTLVLDMDEEVTLARARLASGKPDRLEMENIQFHRKVRAGFLAIAENEPERVVVIDANGTPDEVGERVLSVVMTRLGRNTNGQK